MKTKVFALIATSLFTLSALAATGAACGKKGAQCCPGACCGQRCCQHQDSSCCPGDCCSHQ